jgi:arylsulfatase A
MNIFQLSTAALVTVISALFISFFISVSGVKPEQGTIANRSRPNIVVILADDLGYGDLQCYNPDAQTITPHLNQLSREGLQFTDAHSGSAVCTPTRYGLLTGRYAFRSPLKKGVLGGYSPALIEADRFTIADLLKQAGYQTAAIGKWHLGLNWPGQDSLKPQPLDLVANQQANLNLNIGANLTQGPNDLGFDYSYIIPASLDIPPYIYLENGQPTDRELVDVAGNNEPRGVFWRPGKSSKSVKLENTLDQFCNKAQEFLTKASKQKAPFFLYLPLTSPHTPWLPGKKFQGKSGAGIYGDFVAHTDDVVGRVLSTLDSLGLKENTLIIFTSDNGADWKPGDLEKFPKHRANFIYRGEKSDIWEGGHRVPFLVRWPEAINTARTINQTVCLTDFMATFASLTGQTLPATSGQDSFDFSAVLTPQSSSNAFRQSTIHHSINGLFAIRKGKWKYVEGPGSGGWSSDESATKALPFQLYDLESDPRETSNLVEKQPKIAAELQALVKQQRAQGFTRPGAKE